MFNIFMRKNWMKLELINTQKSSLVKTFPIFALLALYYLKNGGEEEECFCVFRLILCSFCISSVQKNAK